MTMLPAPLIVFGQTPQEMFDGKIIKLDGDGTDDVDEQERHAIGMTHRENLRKTSTAHTCLLAYPFLTGCIVVGLNAYNLRYLMLLHHITHSPAVGRSCSPIRR